MEKAKIYFFKNFEKIIVLSILLIIIIINFFVPYKIGFLNFFYLPIIVAGYFLGRRMAVLTALRPVCHCFDYYFAFFLFCR